VRLSDQEAGETPAYRGFVMALGTLGKNPHTHAPLGWMEQVFVVCNTRTAAREIEGLHQRLDRAEKALAGLARRPGSDLASLQQRVATILDQQRVADYLQVKVEDQVTRQERLIGRGRGGPNHQRQTVETHRLVLTVTQQTTAIQEAEQLAGWRLYVSNTPPEQMSLTQSIDYYGDQWQPERGFHRWKRGGLPALPVYLKYEPRIRGLMVLLSIGLRVLTLVEYVVRRELDHSQEKLAGLYEGNRKRATDRPTTERLLRAFEGIVLYCWQTGEQASYQLTPLSDLHTRILRLMSLPADLYARLVPDAEFASTS
jgi:transposase